MDRVQLTRGFFVSLILSLVLGLSAAAVAQRLDGGVRLNGVTQGLTINNPIFTGTVTASGIVLVGDGTAAAPSIAYISEPTLGLRRRASNIITIEGAAGSVGVFDLSTITNAEHLNVKATGIFGFSSGNADVAVADVAISRVSSGVLGIGTGAGGDFSAAIKATNYISAGSGLAVANVGANTCGTTAATIAGGNNAFVFTVGATAGTQCRVQFTLAATTEWDCAASDDTTTVAVRTTPVDTTHTDFIGTFTAADKVTGICFPR